MDPTIGVGFARHDVTPPVGTAMSGFAARTGGAVGAHDPLEARAMALDDGATRAVVVTLDLIGVDAAMTAAIRDGVRRRCGVEPHHVVVVATHTHGGPAVLRDALLGAVAPATRARVVQGAVAAAAAAVASTQEAEVGFALGREATVARNRRSPGGPIDPDVPILAFGRGGTPIGVVVGYACHPVTLGPDNRLFTRDYPGFLLDRLEARGPGCTAMFLGGCSGQLNTGHLAADSLTNAASSARTFERAALLGDRLATAVVDAMAAGTRPLTGTRLRTASRQVALPYGRSATSPAADALGWREAMAACAPEDAGRRAWLAAQIAWAERFPVTREGEHVVEVAAWALGDLTFAWFPGEVFVEHGLALKASGPPDSLVTVANANAAPGYVPHASAYAAGGYEVEEAFRFYGLPGPYGPEAGIRLEAAMRELVEALR
jgi:neutral ceramidase